MCSILNGMVRDWNVLYLKLAPYIFDRHLERKGLLISFHICFPDLLSSSFSVSNPSVNPITSSFNNHSFTPFLLGSTSWCKPSIALSHRPSQSISIHLCYPLAERSTLFQWPHSLLLLEIERATATKEKTPTPKRQDQIWTPRNSSNIIILDVSIPVQNFNTRPGSYGAWF